MDWYPLVCVFLLLTFQLGGIEVDASSSATSDSTLPSENALTTIKVSTSKQTPQRPSGSYKTSVPPSGELSSSNPSTSFGENVTMEAFEGNITTETLEGNVTMETLEGNITVEMLERNVTMETLEGNVTMETLEGNITMEMLEENVTMELLKGNVTTEMLEGNVTTEMLEGNVTTEMLEGNVTTEMLEGNVTTEMLEGNVTTEMLKGNVTMKLLEGNMTMETLEENVTIKALEGDVTMETASIGHNSTSFVNLSNVTHERVEPLISDVEDTTWESYTAYYNDSEEDNGVDEDNETVSTNDLSTRDNEQTTGTVGSGGVISVAIPAEDKPSKEPAESKGMSTADITVASLVSVFAVGLVLGCVIFGVRLYRRSNREDEPDLVHVRNERATQLI